MHVYTFENNVSLSSLCLGQFTYLATMRACMFETKPHRARKLLSLPGNHEGVHVWDRATRCKDTVILTWLPSGRACLRRSLQGPIYCFLTWQPSGRTYLRRSHQGPGYCRPFRPTSRWSRAFSKKKKRNFVHHNITSCIRDIQRVHCSL